MNVKGKLRRSGGGGEGGRTSGFTGSFPCRCPSPSSGFADPVIVGKADLFESIPWCVVWLVSSLVVALIFTC